MKIDEAGLPQKGVVSAGASLLWRHQYILWWAFAINLVLGALGTLGAARTLNASLSHSLAGNELVKRFDLGMLYELLRLPNANFLHSRFEAFGYAALFAAFMLFVSGGILEVFRQDRRLNTGDFFAASGAFLWRFVRLMLFSLVPFIFLWSLYPLVDKAADYVGDRAVAEEVGIVILTAGAIVLALLAIVVRIWFDVAKVRTVAQNERSMWRNMWTALDMMFHHLGTLLWIYFRIVLFAAIILLVGFLIWIKLPSNATPATFVLLEFVILSQLVARLWQLASVTEWYKRYAEVLPTASIDFMTPQPEDATETRDTTVVPEPDLPSSIGPEVPPTGG